MEILDVSPSCRNTNTSNVAPSIDSKKRKANEIEGSGDRYDDEDREVSLPENRNGAKFSQPVFEENVHDSDDACNYSVTHRWTARVHKFGELKDKIGRWAMKIGKTTRSATSLLEEIPATPRKEEFWFVDAKNADKANAFYEMVWGEKEDSLASLLEE